MSVRANFADIYRECVTEVCKAERNRRGKSSYLIGQQQENKATWFLWFRPSHQWRNLFYFSRREKNRLSIVQIIDQFKFFTLRFLSRKNKEKKFILTNIFFFLTSIQFVTCALRENLSNRPLEYKLHSFWPLFCTLQSAVA